MSEDEMTALINSWNRPPAAALNDPARRDWILAREAEGAAAYLAATGGE
jgi:hypothetical protein